LCFRGLRRKRNFLAPKKSALYSRSKAFLQKPAVKALKRVHEKLKNPVTALLYTMHTDPGTLRRGSGMPIQMN